MSLSLRDKISDVCSDIECDYTYGDAGEFAYVKDPDAAADAILDLLRESVKPLEWYEDGRGGWRTQDYIGMYEVYRNDNELWTFDSSEYVSEHKTAEEAKAEGVKEHLRRIAFTMEIDT